MRQKYLLIVGMLLGTDKAIRINSSHQALLESLIKDDNFVKVKINSQDIEAAREDIAKTEEDMVDKQIEFLKNNQIRVNIGLGEGKDAAAAANATGNATANASKEIDYAAMVNGATNWYDNPGHLTMDKLKDDTPEHIKAHPLYKKMAERFMAGKFKDKALETWHKRIAANTIKQDEIGEEKEREGIYPNELDDETKDYNYGDKLTPTWHSWDYYNPGNWSTYWNNQGTLAPPFDPHAHFESPYYNYGSDRWFNRGYWGGWGFDGNFPRHPLLAQENNTNVVDKTIGHELTDAEIVQQVLNSDPFEPSEPKHSLVQESEEINDDKHKAIEKMGKEVDDSREKLQSEESKLSMAKNIAAHAEKAASGASVVQWSADSKEDADTVLRALFQQQIIADAQVLGSKYERMFLKYNKQQLDTQVLVRMITADTRVNELVQYIKKNNPNHLNKDMATDLMTSQFTSGSQEYIDWIKKQTEDKEVTDALNLQLSQKISLGSHKKHRHHHRHQTDML